MIDLSYLTDEEKGKIQGVLKRDTKLKNLEEQRIKQLRKTERDKSRLKYLTGEWFYESKYNRHREKIHGSDIIRASMGLRKPVTILELSQGWDDKPSLVNREKRDFFIPPELVGLIEEPSTQLRNDRVTDRQSSETQQERPRPQIKPRKNPFNSVNSQKDADKLCTNGVKEADQTPTEEPLAAESSTSHNANLNTDNTKTHVATQCTVKPVPTKRLLLYSCKDTSTGDPSSKQVVTPAPRSILKHNGFIDSPRLRIPVNIDNSGCSRSSATISPPLSPCSVQSASDWLDRRQAHYSSIEQGEHSILDEDWSRLADDNEERDRSDYINNDHHELCAEPQSTQVSNFHSTADVSGKAVELSNECQTHKVTEEKGHSISKVMEWFWRGTRDGMQTKPVLREKNQKEQTDCGTSDAKSPPVLQPKTKPSPKTRRGLFALFSRAEKKDKSYDILVSDEEATSQEKSTSELKPEAVDNKGLQNESKKSEIFQEENENKTGNPVCEDGSQREMFLQDEVSPGRLANLKSFWERGQKEPKIFKIKKGDEPSPLNDNDRNALDSSISLSKSSDPIPNPVNTSEYPVHVESATSEMSALSTSEIVKPSYLDGRKISEGSITKQQIDSSKTDFELVSSSSFHYTDSTPDNKLQGDALADSLSRDISDLKKEISTFKMSLSQQENKISIDDLKSYWNEEKIGLRVLVSSPTHQESSSQRSSIELSKSQLDIRSDSADLMSSLDRLSLSSNKDDGLIVKDKKMEMNEEKQSPNTVPEQDQQDVRGRVPYSIHTTRNFKPQSNLDKNFKFKKLLSPLGSLTSKCQNGRKQSTDISQSKDQDQTRKSSPLRQFKVPPRDSYPKTESRKEGSPLKTFVIDINPANKSPCTVKAKPDQTYEENPSNSLHSFGKICKTNSLKENLMSPPQDSSERLIISLDNNPFHSTAAYSQVSASGQLCMSAEYGKTFEEDINVTPILPKERKLSTDSQSIARLARSYIPLSLEFYLGVSEQAVLNEKEKREMKTGEVSKQVNRDEVSNESSPSQSQHDSEEITFDSSGSSTPEAWSFSHTSSDCDSEEDRLVKAALERAKARPISISKSLEDLTSNTSLTPYTKTSYSDPEQIKMMSMSVPSFSHQEMDYRKGDCASVSSFDFDRLRTYNASTSICSEVASMCSVTGSAMSICSEFGNVEVKGTIQFAIHYLQKLSEFHIFVVQCNHLAVADPKRNRSDPYVKCYLLPDKAKYGKKKTSVRKKTLDPTYNEILRFKIPIDTLKTQKLNLSVWHNDTFGHNSFLGEVELDLAAWDFNNTQMNEYLLKGRVQVPSSPKHSVCSEDMRGEMRVALRFVSQNSDSHKKKVNGEVQIWVKECQNLPISRGSVDPFVKCTFLPDTGRKNRQKTRVLKKACNPEFNHTMVYDGFKHEDLKEACVELTVWDHDRLHNHFIGGIRIGSGTGKSYAADVDWMDSNSSEAALWERMMLCHNEWVEGVLPLRMLVMARTSR